MVSYLPLARRLSLYLLGAWAMYLVALLPAVAAAQRPPAPQLLPDTTLVYVRVANGAAALEKLRETSLGRMLNDPQIRPLIQDLYQSAEDAYKQIEKEVGLPLQQLLAIPQGELCVALVAADTGPPALAFLIEVGDQMPVAEKLLNRIFEAAGANGSTVELLTHRGTDITTLASFNGEQALHLCTRDGVILAASDVDLCKQLLDVWDGQVPEGARMLADNRKFTTIMSKSLGTREERPQVSWFADPIALVRTVSRGNAGAQIGLALLDPLGLNGLEAIGGSIIFAPEEFDMISHAHLLLRSPREGVVKMLALQSGETAPEPWVPKDVVSYMTVNWDFQTTLGELARLYDTINLHEGAFTELVKQRISDRLGVDVQTELLPLLGGRVTLCSRIQRPVKLNSETSLLGVQVTDTDAFRVLLEKVIAKWPDQFSAQSYGVHRYYLVTAGREPPPNFDENLLRRPQPCCALVGDYFLVADSVEFLEKCFTAKVTPGSSLADDLEYKLVASRVQRHSGNITPSLAAFTRPEESLRAMYDLATADSTRQRLSEAATNNKFFGALDGALTKNPLPPFAVIAKYLAPSGSMLLDDSTGLHYISFALRRD